MDKPFPAYKGSDPYVFVCYAHKDSPRVYEDMFHMHDRGVKLWYDEGIPGGTSWRAEIAKALDGSDKLLFFISKHSLESAHCLREVRFALDHEVDVLPIFLEDCELPVEFSLAFGGVQALYREADQLYFSHLEEACLGEAVAAPPVPRPKKKSSRAMNLFVSALLLIALFRIGWIFLGQE